jgi:hypothetical protein
MVDAMSRNIVACSDLRSRPKGIQGLIVQT